MITSQIEYICIAPSAVPANEGVSVINLLTQMQHQQAQFVELMASVTAMKQDLAILRNTNR